VNRSNDDDAHGLIPFLDKGWHIAPAAGQDNHQEEHALQRADGRRPVDRLPLTYLCSAGMLACMRTTIRLDDGLLAEAKQLAARTGRTLTAVIEDALRETLARGQKGEGKRARVQLPTFRGRGLRPGVNLDSTDDLLDVMEEPDDPARR
jgi:hypothetical protein